MYSREREGEKEKSEFIFFFRFLGFSSLQKEREREREREIKKEEKNQLTGDHAELLQALDARRAHGPVVARRRHHHLALEHVRVHAHLRVVVERDERPVGDRAGDAAPSRGVGLDDEVLGGGGVEELDVGAREGLGEERGGHQGRVLDDDVVALVLLVVVFFVCGRNERKKER